MKNPNRLSFYTRRYFLLSFPIILMVGFGTLAFAKSMLQTTGSYTFTTSDLCRQKQLIEIATKNGVSYQLNQGFDEPTIQIIGDNRSIAKTNQEYDNLNPIGTMPSATASTEPPKQCHLPNVKNHVENVNAKLLPYIPNDVDYVSYSPTADKAVYCYYNFLDSFYDPPREQKNGSQCFFIQASKNIYGKDEFELYDISDMERANLDGLKQLWSLRQSNFYGAYSYIDKWEDSPTHYFGFNLATPYNGNRWGGYGEY